jgi:hemolysin activation/secretion protein
MACELPISTSMRFALLPLLAAATLLGQSIQTVDDPASGDPVSDLNVNSRYTVESISFLGQRTYKLSSSALEEMHRLIGSKLNTEALNRLAKSIRSELRAHDVTFKLDRGRDPGSIKVLLEVEKGNTSFDLSIPRFVYNSQQGWTGIGQASAKIDSHVFTFSLVRDSDTLVERFAGFQARYDLLSLGTDRVRLGFEFDTYHEQYDPSSRLALDAGSSQLSSSLGAGAYRSRLNFEPSATFVLAKPLTLTVGFSLEQLQPEFTAARSESANAMVNTLRYHQRWEGSGATKQELDAGYSLRAATKLLGTDLSYTRHAVNARYGYTHDHQSVEVTLVAGLIYGHAPLFERFVLGNSTLLRGWNKFDLDPLGGNRLAYGSVTYGYHIMRVFYDAGSVWNQGQAPEAKQSAGIGVSSGLGLFQKGAFLLAVAFPLRQGHVDPVLIAGMNF